MLDNACARPRPHLPKGIGRLQKLGDRVSTLPRIEEVSQPRIVAVSNHRPKGSDVGQSTGRMAQDTIR